MIPTPSQMPSTGDQTRKRLRSGLLGALVLVLLAVVFIAQNRDPVSIHLFWLHLSAPQWFLLTVTALVGVAVGALLKGRRRG